MLYWVVPNKKPTEWWNDFYEVKEVKFVIQDINYHNYSYYEDEDWSMYRINENSIFITQDRANTKCNKENKEMVSIIESNRKDHEEESENTLRKNKEMISYIKDLRSRFIFEDKKDIDFYYVWVEYSTDKPYIIFYKIIKITTQNILLFCETIDLSWQEYRRHLLLDTKEYEEIFKNTINEKWVLNLLNKFEKTYKDLIKTI